MEYGKSSCQFLSGQRIDQAVVEEFFEVLQPAQIDALEEVLQKQTEHHRQQVYHLEQEVMRLQYEAQRAERQYNRVEPEHRLIAANLEKKWEQALWDLEQARRQLEELQGQPPNPPPIAPSLRESFADVGRRLPELWPRLSLEAKKSLLRTMVEGVNLYRDEEGVAQIRVVWRGGLVTEKRIRVPVHSLRYSNAEQRVAERIRQLNREGKRCEQIVDILNQEGFTPCRGGSFTPQIVNKIKHRHGIVSLFEQARREGVDSAYTIPELAELLHVDASWLYRRISKGIIEVEKDPLYGCYLFPRTKRTVNQLNRMKKGTLAHVSFPKVHNNG